MTQGIYHIVENKKLAHLTYRLILRGDTAALTAPGQFVNVRLEGAFLRRPLSVCDYDTNSITLIYKVIGEGTAAMSRKQAGETLDLLVGLGNGFDTTRSGEMPLLIGGGVGIPPLYRLCKELLAEGKKVSIILGFNTQREVFYEEEFRALGASVFVTTTDGSHGTRGVVTEAMKGLAYSYFYTCGPLPMFRAIEQVARTGGQFSFEEHMACGFGACMGCTCATKYGDKRICRDGPVLCREEIVW
ncbi:MAG: dihydroorotate dehydrogenase electron transfer subunit [Eubacteriales bacterium]